MDKLYKDIFKNLKKGIIIQEEIKYLEDKFNEIQYKTLTKDQQAMVRNRKKFNMDFLTEMEQEDIELFINNLSEENKIQIEQILECHSEYSYKFLMAIMYTGIFKPNTKYIAFQKEKDIIVKLYQKYQLKEEC